MLDGPSADRDQAWLSWLRRLFTVIVPSAAPAIVAGLRISEAKKLLRHRLRREAREEGRGGVLTIDAMPPRSILFVAQEHGR
jgi:hypothetical protein